MMETIVDNSPARDNNNQNGRINNIPLTWNEARSKLLKTLQEWETCSKKKKTKKSELKKSAGSSAHSSNMNAFEIKNLYFLDMLVSIIQSALILILGLYFPSKQVLSTKRNLIISGSLLLFFSLLSLVLSIQRQRVARRGLDSVLRNSVCRFISYLSDLAFNDSLQKSIDKTNQKDSNEFKINSEMGTSFTDIYPVYRRCHTTNVHKKQDQNIQWQRIPTLLLVEGDFIALQIGDVVPANVELFHNPTIHFENSTCLTLQKGEKVTMSSIHVAQPPPPPLNSNSKRSTHHKKQRKVTSNNPFHLPYGRIQLESGSRELLDMCNGMKIFVVKETPLKSFLNQPKKKHSLPQIHRQIHALRFILFIASLIMFLLSIVILLTRQAVSLEDFSSSDSDSAAASLLLTIPLISSLALLPLHSPVVVYILEILGTSRIMTDLQQFSKYKRDVSSEQVESTPDTNAPISENEGYFSFFHYVIATFSSRFFSKNYLQTLYESKIHYSVPPTNSYLLEKLGVVTAVALVDDELVCEPFSSPQQLLIPSARGGFKLLDLFPHCDDSQSQVSSHDDNHEDDHNFRRRSRRSRGISIDSFDSDSDGASFHDLEQQQQHPQQQFYSLSMSSLDLNNKKRRYNSCHRNIKLNFFGSSCSVHPRSSGEMSREMLKFLFKQQNKKSNLVENLLVQFEDPCWWKFLPSLKCIGLACLLVNGKVKSQNTETDEQINNNNTDFAKESKKPFSTRDFPPLPILGDCPSGNNDSKTKNKQGSLMSTAVEKALVPFICQENNPKKQQHQHLLSLANCIGFTNQDLSSFYEAKRIHIISMPLLHDRLSTDKHALGLVESRNWGLLRPDTTSVVIQDSRTKSYQLLTLGNAKVVLSLCADSWQGEHSTIVPLNNADRNFILETCNNWELADMDVAAFSYSPVPYTLEPRLTNNEEDKNNHCSTYLVDNRMAKDSSSQSHFHYHHHYNSKGNSLAHTVQASNNNTISQKVSDWNLVTNQIFLGVLGSSVSPRKIISSLIDQCTDAGVRFVYFSPRNMRRTKELASQMGIDVAWNCAISLRPLDKGQQDDPHRMVSHYADWDVNAKLPHGIKEVNRHLEEVDNVPLLVRLYTDVTESTTAEMVSIFQKYHDVVMVLGLRHSVGNFNTFASADFAIGIDIFYEKLHSAPSYVVQTSSNKKSNKMLVTKQSIATPSLLTEELKYISEISSYACVLNLNGASSTPYITVIFNLGRIALQSVISAGGFFVFGCLSLSLLAFFCTLSISTVFPFVPCLHAVLYITVLLPLLTYSLSMTDINENFMKQVPPKNDPSFIFAATRDEGYRLAFTSIVRAIIPAFAGHLIYLISFGELILALDAPSVIKAGCVGKNTSTSFLHTEELLKNYDWISIMRCKELKNYKGLAKSSACLLMICEMTFCVIVASSSYAYRTQTLFDEPLTRNRAWFLAFFLALLLLALSLFFDEGINENTLITLPWYYFLLSFAMPTVSLIVCEIFKRKDRYHEDRAAKYRRLQFETRLGMWSPK